jgi:hypothetical protein
VLITLNFLLLVCVDSVFRAIDLNGLMNLTELKTPLAKVNEAGLFTDGGGRPW